AQMAMTTLNSPFGDLDVAAVYLPPRPTWTCDGFEALLNLCGDKAILGGDFNAKHRNWGNFRADRRGTMLVEALDNTNTQILATGRPTCFPCNGRTPSALDFALLKGLHGRRLTINESFELSSDHIPLIVNLHLPGSAYVPRRTLLPPGSNVRMFRRTLEDSIHLHMEINSAEDVDDAAILLEDKIKAAAELATPPDRS
ncbi:hypothetical protein KR059_007186, partial [Drosophila kikkawai]